MATQNHAWPCLAVPGRVFSFRRRSGVRNACVKNAYPQHESVSKMRTLKQKVDVEARQLQEHQNASKTFIFNTKMHQTCAPFGRKSTSKPFSSWGTKCTCPPAAFLKNKRYSRCLISTRAWAAGWLGAWLAGWGTKMR